ncbi:hypothetical protein PVK06_002117 [Gossypium arboreum]|uniref:Retrotransposon gag domain-containing protein n=1 Tax=Gossypium arboreum TaxID=29729 RepID=A0ABR0R2R6_GOSAR|nr:hypothetical protein PVK06_002117 [Gossypium arboreum]
MKELFEQYLGHSTQATPTASAVDKGKGVVGGHPPGFPPKEHLPLSPLGELSNMLRPSSWETSQKVPKLEKSVRLASLLHSTARGFHFLTWPSYAHHLKERFGSSTYKDPMAELVKLKQRGTVDSYHDTFISLLNQLQLLENYALNIFTSNLKAEIGQYLQLFKPTSFVEGFLVARQVGIY